MNTKSKLKAILIGIAAIMMVSLFAVMSVSASLVLTDCWIGDDNRVSFTIYSGAKAEGHARLDVNGAYEESKRYSLNAGDKKTLSFREYRWSDCEDVEVCVEGSCCNPIEPTPIPTPTPTPTPTPPPGPDLVITDIRNNDGTIYFAIENRGTEEAGSSYTSLYVNGAYQARKKVGSLDSRETKELCFRYVYTPGTDDIIKVCADRGNDVAESNEGNNCKELIPGGKPDLVIEDKCEEFVDGQVIVHFVVKNIGDAEAGASYATLYIDDVLVETQNVPALASGSSTFAHFMTPEGEPYPFDVTITITVCADNTHVVEESDETNNCMTDEFTCPPPPGEYWAVITGVSDYADPSIHDLSYCDDDANDIYSRLLSYDNWKASNIVLLIDSAATKANIHNAIDWMKTKADADDICLFLFSGHGARETDMPPYDEADGRDEYICPHDSLLTSDTNDIRDDELDDWMTPIKGKKVVLLDTCFSGGFVKTPEYTIKTKPGIPYMKPTGKMLGDGFTKDLDKSGYVTLTASQDTEFSYECPALENGVFLYYVDEGLAGPANADDDLDISAEETYDYANPKVVSYYTEQHPQIYDGVTGELPVVKW